MGNILFGRKKFSNVEQLEDLEEQIQYLQNVQQNNLWRKKSYSNKFTLVTIIFTTVTLYLLNVFVWNQSFINRLKLILSAVFFLSVIIGIRKFIHWLYSSKYIKNESLLIKLKEKKAILLEEIMEKETYKKAKDIIEKFDSDHRIINSKSESQVTTPIGLRQRQKIDDASSLETSNILNQSCYTTPPPSLYDMKKPKLKDPNQSHLIRPLIKKDRSVFDRMIDMFLGDGPENSFALICSKCCTHNGLASKEQYKSIGYYCINCNFLNEPDDKISSVLESSSVKSYGDSNSKNNMHSTPLAKPNEVRYVRPFVDANKLK